VSEGCDTELLLRREERLQLAVGPQQQRVDRSPVEK
jgi:hypothetical protein